MAGGCASDRPTRQASPAQAPDPRPGPPSPAAQPADLGAADLAVLERYADLVRRPGRPPDHQGGSATRTAPKAPRQISARLPAPARQAAAATLAKVTNSHDDGSSPMVRNKSLGHPTAIMIKNHLAGSLGSKQLASKDMHTPNPDLDRQKLEFGQEVCYIRWAPG